MGRKNIKDLEQYKFSLDIGGDNKKALDILTDNLGSKYGPVINLLIKTFCRMPETVKQSLLEFCIFKAEQLEVQKQNTDKYWTYRQESEKQSYLQIAKIINDGIEIKVLEGNMKRIELKDGHLVCPADWFILNPEQAHESLYAGVVECRNWEKFGIPHFVFFSNRKYGSDYDDEFVEYINEMCVKSWPQFQEVVIEKQVNLIADPEKRGSYLNAKEHLESPFIGHFHISEEGEDEDPPFGAIIIRNC